MDVRHYLQGEETLRQRAKCPWVLFFAIVLSGIATPAAAQVESSAPVTLLQDIVLVLDNSGSMAKNDPRFLTKQAVAGFVKGVPDDARLAVVIFDKQVRATPLGSRDAVNLAQFNYRGPLTNIPAAVQQAIQELKLNGRPGAARSMVLLTDGVVDTGTQARDGELTRWLRERLASDADDGGIKIVTVALSAGSDIHLLRELAQRTGGRYFHAPQAKDLPGIFMQISRAFFAPAVSQAPSKRVPQLAQLSPRTPVAGPAPSNLPQAEPPKVRGENASTLPGNAPPREPQPRADIDVTAPPVVPTQPPSGVGTQEHPLRFVVVAAFLIGGILALVAALLWYRERKPRAKSDPRAPTPMAYLFDINGVTGRKRHELGADTVIGRVPMAEHSIVINRPTIGRVHAVIEHKHHGFWLIDQNSKNGTYVNGQLVTTPTCLTHGDRVHFHEFPFEFSLARMIFADVDATVVIDGALRRDSNALQPSEAHAEMGQGVLAWPGTSAPRALRAPIRPGPDRNIEAGDSRPREQTTNPATTAYGSEEPASSKGDGEVDRDAKQPIKVLLGVLAIVALVAMGGWLAGSRIESPAEAAARTAPPRPSPILVPVEERVLSSAIVTRGTARFGLPQPISLAPSAVKANTASLITRLPVLNTQLKEGDVMLTASGRPLLVLQGGLPAFRDLVPGISGEDVLQLEQGLERLGFDPGPTDGIYDEQTSAAVAKWYSSVGYEPFGLTIEQKANIRTLEQSLGDALKMKLSAARSATTAVRAVESARAKAVHAERVAAAELAAKIANPNRGVVTPNDQTRLAVESARAKAESANKAAAAEVDAKIVERALIVLDSRHLETARTAADTKLEMARAAVKAAQLEGELAVRAAERDANLVARQLKLAEAAVRAAKLEGEVAIRAALDAQKVAQFDAKLTAERADRAAADLDMAKRKLGVQVPIDEIVFIPSLPVRVEKVTAAVGGVASGPVLSVTDNQITIDSSLPIDAAPLVKPGMEVIIDEQALGIKAKGVVDIVDKTPGTRGVDGYHIYFAVRVGETPTPLQGFSLRLTIPIESTKGRVTAVPMSALSLAADGRSRIQLENNGALEYLVVEPGMAAEGFVGVTPVNGTLKPGQLVVVGYNNREKMATQP